jgi:hypothetical protein
MVMILSSCGSNTDNQNSVVTADISDKNSSTIVSHTDVNTTNDKKITLSGKIINSGEISGATIFLDLNKNGELDSSEPKTESSKDGSYLLTLKESHIESLNY